MSIVITDIGAPQIRDAGRHYSDAIEARIVSKREWNDEHARQLQSLSPSDVLDELADYEEALQIAQQDGAEAVGRVYLAARTALAHRLTARALGVSVEPLREAA